MVDKLQKQLESAGLQEKEAKVYLAALELGQATAQAIAEKAQIKRPTAYFIIEGLMVQGLMSSFTIGKKQYFVAARPERLLELIREEKKAVDQREESFRHILPQLESFGNRKADKPVVKYYEGKEGIVSMVNEYTEKAHGQELSIAFSRDVLETVMDKETLDQMSKDRHAHKIKVKSIYTNSKGNLPNRPHTQRMRLDAKEFPISCDIAIYEDVVRITSFKGRVLGIAIEDREIAKSFKAIFELAWKWANRSR